MTNATVYPDSSVLYKGLTGFFTDREGNMIINSSSIANTVDCCEPVKEAGVGTRYHSKDIYEEITVACCEAVPTECAPCRPWANQKAPPPQEKKMYNNLDVKVTTPTPTPTDQIQRGYLNERLSDVLGNKQHELRPAFYMDNMERPKSFQELIDRIAAKQYEIEDKKLNLRTYHPFDFVTWRDPAHPADAAGYTAAMEKLDDATTATRDVIAIKSPEEGLAALQAFEATTFH